MGRLSGLSVISNPWNTNELRSLPLSITKCTCQLQVYCTEAASVAMEAYFVLGIVIHWRQCRIWARCLSTTNCKTTGIRKSVKDSCGRLNGLKHWTALHIYVCEGSGMADLKNLFSEVVKISEI